VIARLARRWVDVAGGGFIPLMFFIIVASLTAFAVGPDAALLARIGSGSLWVAALLAALLPVGTLVADDVADGTLDQLRVRGLALETIMAARLVAHWLSFAPALFVAAVVGGAMLNIKVAPLLVGLAIGTPALAGLGLVAAALVAGARGGAALAGLVVLPLALPVLIFGAGEAPRLLAAASLALTALSPFAAAAALRVADG
jgi:heme exporter protein B